MKGEIKPPYSGYTTKREGLFADMTSFMNLTNNVADISNQKMATAPITQQPIIIPNGGDLTASPPITTMPVPRPTPISDGGYLTAPVIPAPPTNAPPVAPLPDFQQPTPPLTTPPSTKPAQPPSAPSTSNPPQDNTMLYLILFVVVAAALGWYLMLSPNKNRYPYAYPVRPNMYQLMGQMSQMAPMPMMNQMGQMPMQPMPMQQDASYSPYYQ